MKYILSYLILNIMKRSQVIIKNWFWLFKDEVQWNQILFLPQTNFLFIRSLFWCPTNVFAWIFFQWLNNWCVGIFFPNVMLIHGMNNYVLTKVYYRFLYSTIMCVQFSYICLNKLCLHMPNTFTLKDWFPNFVPQTIII